MQANSMSLMLSQENWSFPSLSASTSSPHSQNTSPSTKFKTRKESTKSSQLSLKAILNNWTNLSQPSPPMHPHLSSKKPLPPMSRVRSIQLTFRGEVIWWKLLHFLLVQSPRKTI
jgi:hypothetical protein